MLTSTGAMLYSTPQQAGIRPISIVKKVEVRNKQGRHTRHRIEKNVY
jgi:hypothetical protein